MAPFTVRPSFPSRRAAEKVVTLFAGFALAGCAGGPSPVYRFEPTPEPLRYTVSGEGSQSVTTPMGPQETSSSETAVILIGYDARTGEGSPFNAVFDSLDVSLETPMGKMQPEVRDVLGRSFEGIAAPDGDLLDVKLPDVDLGSYGTANLIQIVSDLVPPLPPGEGPSGEAWPWRVTLPPGGELDGSLLVDGNARLAGDSTWNGSTLRLIRSEGTITLNASGTPPTAPAPIEVSLRGTAKAVWLWDDTRGILVAARIESETTGSITMASMGLDLPMNTKVRRDVHLVE